MSTYKLQYFNGKGRAELARLIFHAAGQNFEDERLGGEKWQALKPNTPYGQLPVLMVDNKEQIHQSAAIFRHLAKKLGLYGDGIDQETKCDMIGETVNEVFTEMIKMFFEKDEDKKELLCKHLKEKSLPKLLDYLTKILKANGGKYLVGSKLSMADLAFFDLMDKMIELPEFGEDVWKEYKELEGLFTTVKSIPNIKKYLLERPKTAF